MNQHAPVTVYDESVTVASVFDANYDPLFANLISITEALLNTAGVRISFIAGDSLKGRAINIGEPMEMPLNATLCGIAVKRGSALEISHAQTDEISCDCPAVKKAGVNFYANRLIRIRGGEIVGTLCLFDKEPRILNNRERDLLDGLEKVAGHVVQAILDQKHLSDNDSDGAFISRVNFMSLFEVSPVPTAVLSYPECLYVAANDPMMGTGGLPLDRLLSENEGDPENGWFPDFRKRLDADGSVSDMELEFHNEEGLLRHFLVDGRIIQFDGDEHVLITGRDISAERERDRSLRLLLEGTNIHLGDDWFRGAAEAFTELLDAELVLIAELLDPENDETRKLRSHAAYEKGKHRKVAEFELNNDLVCPVFEGKSVTLNDEEVDPEFARACPFWKPGIRYMQGLPIAAADNSVIGLIVMGSTRPMKALPSDHEAIFTIFASRAAAEIERLRSDRAREAELKRTTLLLEISGSISRETDPQAMLEIAVSQIGKALEVSRCQLLLLEKDHLRVNAEFLRESIPAMKKPELPRGENTPVDRILTSTKSFTFSTKGKDNELGDWLRILKENDVKSLLAMRTFFEGEAKGMLVLHQCDKNRKWSAEEKSLIEGIAAQIGVGIARAELAERERQLRIAAETARRKAEEASRSKSDFLARMSHELRTPMNAILGFSQLLVADNNLSEKQQDTLSIINRSGEHLMALINDVLEMSKIEAGKLEMNRSLFSPSYLVKSLTEMFQVRAESKGLDLIVDMPDNFPDSIESDENKLRQILTNLLGNAIKFTNEGTVELKAWYFPKEDSGKDDAVLAFRVKDSGIGISEVDQKLLFAPFVQTEEGSSFHEGTGLGLTITKAFVELFGGEIELESEKGVGSTFVFWIPAREVQNEPESEDKGEDYTATSRAQEREADATTTPTVLIADDQPENRLLVVRYLKSLGFIVREAVDGQDAIDAVREYHPDAIIMDIRMPGTDGLAATGTIRGMDDIPFQPHIVALTGNAFEEDRKKAFAAGCDDFLAKPFKLEELQASLSQFENRLPCSRDAETS